MPIANSHLFKGFPSPPQLQTPIDGMIYGRRRQDCGLLTPGPGAKDNPWLQPSVDGQTPTEGEGADAGRIEAALIAAEQGRLIPLGDIRAWFESLGSDNVEPMPRARRWGDRIRPAGTPTLTDNAAQSLGRIEWWYALPGGGGGGTASIRRVRSILGAIDRLVANPGAGVFGPVPGTMATYSQLHQIVYQLVACEGAADGTRNAIILDILGPPQP